VDTRLAGSGPLRFSSNDMPRRDRVPAWREFVGRSIMRVEIEPAADVAFYADVKLWQLPGICVVSNAMSPARFTRTPTLVADGNEDISFFVSTSGGIAGQRGREVTLQAGDAYALNAAEAGTYVAPPTQRHHCFQIHAPRSRLAPLVGDLDRAILRCIPPSDDTLRYVVSYLRFLEKGTAVPSPDVAKATGLHLQDLLVLMLGPTRDAAAVAAGRGLRAARLQTIKNYIVSRSDDRALTVGALAARYRLTPRYVQRLFESEGTTFSEFLLNQRLSRACDLLAKPENLFSGIGTIALAVGFDDISYFNRCFRRRFGAAPSELRGVAARRPL
jgi:AraC-like DNA-binding protein